MQDMHVLDGRHTRSWREVLSSKHRGTSLKEAEKALMARLTTGDKSATTDDSNRIPVSRAIEEYSTYIVDRRLIIEARQIQDPPGPTVGVL
jgi:hypothetical protein